MNGESMRFIALAFFLVSSLSYADDCVLKGMWKSDKEKTLADLEMRSIELTAEQRDFFYGDFFGKLIIDNNCSSYITYFDDEVGGGIEKRDYEVLYEGDTSMTLRFEEFNGEMVVRTLMLTEDRNCYSILLGTLGFREYFCRVN